MSEAEIVLSASLAVAFRMTLDLPIDLAEIAAEMHLSVNVPIEDLHNIITARKRDIVTKAMSLIKLFS